MKKYLLILTMFFVSVMFVGCSFNQQQTKQIDQVSNQVPNLVLKNYNNEDVRLQDFVGTPLVINSWASWCPFCVDELPDFEHMQKEFGESVQIIAINRGDNLEKAKKFTTDLGLDSSVVFLLDEEDIFYKTIQGFAMPESIFVNAAGEITFHKRGFMTPEEMKKRIQDIL